MIKNSATIKVDTEENWNKAVNYVPDAFTIIVFQYEDQAPKIKMGDGIHKVMDLPFLDHKEVQNTTLIM